MRVLELFGEPISNGGQESFVINILQHIKHDDIIFDVLTPYYCDNDYYKEVILDKGGNVFCLNLKFNPGKNRLNLINSLKKFLRNREYDAIHIHSGSISVLAEAAYIARKAKISKIIVHSHCAVAHKSLRYRISKFIFTPILNKCPTHYLACSLLAGKAKFSKAVIKNKLVIMKNGVDLEKFSFNDNVRRLMRNNLAISDDTIVLGHVGRFSLQKNQEFLLKVLSMLNSTGKKVRLLLIGSGETMGKIIDESKQIGLYDKITFIGTVNNVSDYMQAMDVFLLPSRYEGLPIVGVEAQAIGLPCIFSDNITKEVRLTDNVAYLPINNDAIQSWTEQIIDFHLKFCRNNAELISSKGFNIQDTANLLYEIYRTN